jgi:hypothetical protein
MFTGGFAEIPAADPCEAAEPAAAEGLDAPEFTGAGEVTGGLLACGGTAGGFGAKYLAQSKITTIDSSDASTMRISWLSLLVFCGSLTNGPLPA